MIALTTVADPTFRSIITVIVLLVLLGIFLKLVKPHVDETIGLIITILIILAAGFYVLRLAGLW